MKKILLTLCLVLSASAFAKKVPLTNDVFKIVNKKHKTDQLRLFVSERVVARYVDFDRDADVGAGIDFLNEELYHKEIIKKNRRGKFVSIEEDRHNDKRAYRLYVTFSNDCNKSSCAYEFTRQGHHGSAQFVLTRVPNTIKNPGGDKLRFSNFKKGGSAVLRFDQGLIRRITRSSRRVGGV